MMVRETAPFSRQSSGIEAAAADHDLALNPGLPGAELVVWTDDTDEAYTALLERGVVSLSPPHDFLTSLRCAWVADPEGHPIQIVAHRAVMG